MSSRHIPLSPANFALTRQAPANPPRAASALFPITRTERTQQVIENKAITKSKPILEESGANANAALTPQAPVSRLRPKSILYPTTRTERTQRLIENKGSAKSIGRAILSPAALSRASSPPRYIRSMWWRAAGVWLLVAGMGFAASDLAPAQRQLNIDSFEYVWKTVRDKHWDPKLNGVDWQAVHDELLPRVRNAGDGGEARAAMNEMLGRLKQTHFEVFPASTYNEIGGEQKAEGGPGLEVRVVGGRELVTRVMAGSPAQRAGVRPGWEILRIEGRPVAPGLKEIARRFQGSTEIGLMQVKAIAARLNGEIGKTVEVEFRNGHGAKQELALGRAEPPGLPAQLGNLPPLHMVIEAYRAAPRVGYLRFNLFFDPETLIQKTRHAVEDCRACDGFVIDLRGNPGGLGALAMGLAGWFLDRSGLRLGEMILRASNLQFVVFPRPEPFRGPLGVLVDDCSASTSEIFAGGLQDLKRARIFGTRTAGAALPSMFERLPNGDGFQYAVGNYISAGGKPLEGNGVTPDEAVAPSRAALLAGHDPILDAALNWIDKQEK
jgi:carboxyl-terminal processing protease